MGNADYYYKNCISILKQFETGIVVNEDGRRKHDLTKNILRVMYHTRMGDFIWTKFNQFMHRPLYGINYMREKFK